MAGLGAAAVLKIVFFVVVAGATAYSAYRATKGAKQGRSDDGVTSGLRANTRSTQEPLKIIYGKLRVGGNDVYITTTGSNNNIMWIVQTLAEGECEGIDTDEGVDQVFLGDKLYNEYGGNAVYFFHSGTSSQAVDSNLNSAIGEWTDPLHYVSYIVFQLTYSADYFQSLPSRQVLLKGRKLTDFRDSPPTNAWSDNPVLALYDYMTNSRYGLGFSTAAFDLTTWASAANYCDTKGWTLNLAISSDEQAWDVVNNILIHFRGTLIWYDGKFYLRYADLNYESSEMTISDMHLVQDESGRAQVSIAEPTRFQRPDFMKVTFIDPEKGYVDDSIPIGDSAGVGRDLALTGCTDRDQAAQLGVYYLERAQLDRSMTGLFRDDTMRLEPHDVVTVTLSALAISDQLMRVTDVQIQPSGIVALTMLYEDATLYDDDYNLTAENIYTCNLPNTLSEPPTVSNVIAVEETYNDRINTFTFTRLKVTFDPPTDYNWFDHVEVWVSYDDSTWKHQFNSTNDFNLDRIEEGVGIYVRLKTVSIFGTKSSDNNDYKIYKFIDGYSDEPTSLTDLQALANENAVNLYAVKVNDPNIEIYEFRLGSSWSGSIFLAALRSPNMSLTGVKPSGAGGHTFMANTLSNNGRYGPTARSATVVIKDPPDGWAVQDTKTCNYGTELGIIWKDSGVIWKDSGVIWQDSESSGGAGTHDNTEHTTYDSDDYLKCSHTAGVLTGNYTSPIYDLGASSRYLVYCLADIIVTGAGTTWGDVIPTPNTWESIDITTRTWTEIFELAAGPKVSMKLNYGESSPPTNSVERMEILSAIVTGRYFQMEITITDPGIEVNALVNDFILKFLQ